MADLSDLETQLTELVASIVVPGGYTPTSVATSVLGGTVRIYRGWPVDAPLGTDLKAGTSNISIFSMPHATRDTTRFLQQMTTAQVAQATPTMTAALSSNVVYFTGSGSTAETIGVAVGHSTGTSIRLSDDDTPATVAATLATALGGSANAGMLTLPTGVPITVTIGMDVTTLTEVHRQQQTMKVSLWCPTPADRDALARLIDPAVQNTRNLFFDDGSVSGPLISAGTYVDDVPQKMQLWRRDLHYKIEYPTTVQQILPVVVLETTNTTTPDGTLLSKYIL